MATVSARHSSIDEETAPRTEPGVWPGLYQVFIFSLVRGLVTYANYQGIQKDLVKRSYLVQVKVEFSLRILREELSGSFEGLIFVEIDE